MFGIGKADLKTAVVTILIYQVLKRIPATNKYLM